MDRQLFIAMSELYRKELSRSLKNCTKESEYPLLPDSLSIDAIQILNEDPGPKDISFPIRFRNSTRQWVLIGGIYPLTEQRHVRLDHTFIMSKTGDYLLDFFRESGYYTLPLPKSPEKRRASPKKIKAHGIIL